MSMPAGHMPASTSLTAFRRLKSTGALTEREEAVLAVIESFGETGCIFDQVQAALPHLPNSVSGRFLALERKGLIVRTGATRPGLTGNPQKVMWHCDYAPVEPTVVPTKRAKNPFMAGLMYAARIVAAGSDLESVKRELRDELVKVARRSRTHA